MSRFARFLIPIISVVGVIALFFVPRKCAACMPSGGPGEWIDLRLESIKKDGVSVPLTDRTYPATSVEIDGVGPSFGLVIMRGDTAVVGFFAK
jgi:hypothetical protein